MELQNDRSVTINDNLCYNYVDSAVSVVLPAGNISRTLRIISNAVNI